MYTKNLFKRNSKKKQEKKGEVNEGKIRYRLAAKRGSMIGNLMTSVWNSQQKPGKAYVFGRRVHHGEVGILMGLANLLRKSRPDAAGVLSGIGDSLAKDDIADKNEWFTFKKKMKNPSSSISASESNDEKGITDK